MTTVVFENRVDTPLAEQAAASDASLVRKTQFNVYMYTFVSDGK